MKTYEETLSSVLERSREAIVERKQRQKRIKTTVSVAAACIVFVSVALFAVGNLSGADLPFAGVDMSRNQTRAPESFAVQATENATSTADRETSPQVWQTTDPVSEGDSGVISTTSVGDTNVESWVATTAPVEPSTEPATYIMLKWEERHICSRFGEFMYNSATYCARFATLPADMVGGLCGTATAEGYDEITNTVHTTSVNLYAIKGISSHCALAAELEGTAERYIYVNSWYAPATLGELINDLNLRENLTLSTTGLYDSEENGMYTSTEYAGIDSSKVWEMLLGDVSAKYVDEEAVEIPVTAFTMGVDLKLLGYENISLGFTDNGYLVTNILDTAKVFFIGEERVNAFKTYLFENCKGTVVYSFSVVDEGRSQVDVEHTTGPYVPPETVVTVGVSQ